MFRRPITKFASVYDAVEHAADSNYHANPRIFNTDDFKIPSAAARWRRGPSLEQIRRVEAWMEKLDASLHDREKPTWIPSPYGAYPCVPEYLAGEHFSMRAKVMVESDAAPITVWVELGLSQSFTQEQAERRAAAIAALLMKLSETRPVEAKIICASTVARLGTDGLKFVQIDVDAKMFDAQYITQALAMPEIVRPLRWALIVEGFRDAYNIGFAFQSEHGGELATPRRERSLREQFDMQPQDIVIQAAYARDRDAGDMIRDPIKWVHGKIDHQRDIENILNLGAIN